MVFRCCTRTRLSLALKSHVIKTQSPSARTCWCAASCPHSRNPALHAHVRATMQGRNHLDALKAYCAAYALGDDPLVAAREDSSAFQWDALARDVSKWFKTPPGVNCMLGPLDAEAKVGGASCTPLLCSARAGCPCCSCCCQGVPKCTRLVVEGGGGRRGIRRLSKCARGLLCMVGPGLRISGRVHAPWCN